MLDRSIDRLHDRDMDNTKEEWKPVVGYEKFYECSNLGRFRSLPKVINGRWGTACYKGRVVKTMKSSSNGYGLLSLVSDTRKLTVRSHRFIAKTWIPNPDGKPYINHIDCDKMNNRIDNLEWVTAKENTAHIIKLGRFNPLRGEAAINSKLKDTDIPMIRDLYSEGFYQREIGALFGVTRSVINAIIVGKSWTHVV